MSEDARTDATVERMARVEQEKLDHDHGQHILDAASEATQGRAERDRALLGAIGRTTKAKGQE